MKNKLLTILMLLGACVFVLNEAVGQNKNLIVNVALGIGNSGFKI